MIDDSIFNRWKKEYIEGINLENIEYLTLTEKELELFVRENYFDQTTNKLISRQLDSYRPIGLTYLSFDSIVSSSPYEVEKTYLIGVCTNQKGTKTILSVIKYVDNFLYYENYTIPQTFFGYVEVNDFFRQKGLCKQIIDVFAKQINPNNPVLITEESVLGRRCKTINMVKSSLIQNGFTQSIKSFGEFTREYYDNRLQMLLEQKSN